MSFLISQNFGNSITMIANTGINIPPTIAAAHDIVGFFTGLLMLSSSQKKPLRNGFANSLNKSTPVSKNIRQNKLNIIGFGTAKVIGISNLFLLCKPKDWHGQVAFRGRKETIGRKNDFVVRNEQVVYM